MSAQFLQTSKNLRRTTYDRGDASGWISIGSRLPGIDDRSQAYGKGFNGRDVEESVMKICRVRVGTTAS